MRKSKKVITMLATLVVAVLVMAMPSVVVAQDNTMNIFSNYSMYGLGELQTQGTLATRSMGGAGVAMRSADAINLLNPAAYSVALSRGILFSAGLEGGSYTLTQSGLSNKFTTSNFHDVAIQMPIAKRLGLGFSVTPYSSVGYKYSDSVVCEGDMGGVALINVNQGSGDITNVKLGAGWGVTDKLSVGIAALYYWGTLDREFSTTIYDITTTSSPLSTVGDDQISVSSIKGQLGVQYSIIESRKRVLSVGATFDTGGDLRPRSVRTVSSSDSFYTVYAQSDTTEISIVLPRQLSVGVQYATSKVRMALDYTYQNWDSENSAFAEYSSQDVEIRYRNVHTIKAGVEYIPRRGDIRKYFNRVNYRAGFRYGGYQYTFNGEKLNQLAITAGAGCPIDMIGISKVDIGLEWGTMGSAGKISGSDVGLIKQNYFKIGLGFTMFGADYWFQRPQID